MNSYKADLTLRTAALGIGAALALATTGFGQVIRLEKQITIDPHQDVRLGDIATVTGVDSGTAEMLSNTVILSNVEATRNIKAESVLMALISQRGPAALGSGLQVSGSAQCLVKVATQVLTPALQAQPAAIAPAPAVALQKPVNNAGPAAAAIPAPATQPAIRAEATSLAALIEVRVQQELAASADDVRVTIDTINPLLRAPVAAGRKWLCRPMTRTLLGTVVFEAQLVEGPRVIEKLNVQTRVERRQMVAISQTKLERGDLVGANSVHMGEAWLDRNIPTLFTTGKDVIGLEAQRAIEPGSMLDQRDFKAAMMVNKGDEVTVYYITGSLKVQIRARAMQPGKLHDLVEVQNETNTERYRVTLIGRGLAVAGTALNESDEHQLVETR